jgi:putative endonuclease
MTTIVNRQALGAWGEALAQKYLENHGYEIIERNYRCGFGEIDLICLEAAVWCFVEVKTRKNSRFGLGYQAITPVKQQHLIKAAATYLDKTGLGEVAARFDVVSIDFRSSTSYRITLIRNAFEVLEEV